MYGKSGGVQNKLLFFSPLSFAFSNYNRIFAIKMFKYVFDMNWLTHIFVWLSRITQSRGFGVQSPTDYHLVRYVINEHWPYYAYATLGSSDSWKKRKIGLLCFRLTNWLQPQQVFDACGMATYVRAACAKTLVSQTLPDRIDFAIVPITMDVKTLFPHCDDHSLVLFLDVDRHKTLWQHIVDTPCVIISYDLYYCGIVMFDSKRTKQHYKINF